MKKIFLISIISFLCLGLAAQKRIRQPLDTIGFATKAYQMDSIMKRIDRIYKPYFDSVNVSNDLNDNTAFRLAICPHDDYTYAGFLYESVLSHVKAKTIIFFGVAHKAKKFNVEQKLVFDSFDEWKEPYGNIAVSPLREEIIKNLPKDDYIIHDSLQQAEHSVEALIPFLQYHNRDIRIVSILIPYMDFTMMEKYSKDLSNALIRVMKQDHLRWGEDLALVISNDAVHYGDEDWGGKNFATYGCDENGYEKAIDHEHEIINSSLLPTIDTISARKFFNYTVQQGYWREYQWPWCGRYSVPSGLLSSMDLAYLTGEEKLHGIMMGYATSISHKPLNVEDLQMGKTAIANLHHWVGYAAIGYR